MHWNGDWPMGWVSVAWILIAFIGLCILAVVVYTSLRANRSASRDLLGHTHEPIETAEDVLKRRYAKGEIDRETYERMLEDLRK